MTLGRGRVTKAVGLPGTGLFYTSRQGTHTGYHSAKHDALVTPDMQAAADRSAERAIGLIVPERDDPRGVPAAALVVRARAKRTMECYSSSGTWDAARSADRSKAVGYVGCGGTQPAVLGSLVGGRLTLWASVFDRSSSRKSRWSCSAVWLES